MNVWRDVTREIACPSLRLPRLFYDVFERRSRTLWNKFQERTARSPQRLTHTTQCSALFAHPVQRIEGHDEIKLVAVRQLRGIGDAKVQIGTRGSAEVVARER